MTDQPEPQSPLAAERGTPPETTEHRDYGGTRVAWAGEVAVRVVGDNYSYSTDGGFLWSGWLSRWLQPPGGEVKRLVRSTGLWTPNHEVWA